MSVLHVIPWAALAWALAALAMELWFSRPRRADPAVPAGRAGRGVLYNLTTAMLPTHKESARTHPGKLLLGFALHIGIFVALFDALLLAVRPSAGAVALLYSRPLAALALLAGLVLLLRRAFSGPLRALSAPDDYAANVLTCGVLAATLLDPGSAASTTAVLVAASVLLFALPVGKLRHAAFCPAARVDLGRRLGLRGVFPPPKPD